MDFASSLFTAQQNEMQPKPKNSGLKELSAPKREKEKREKLKSEVIDEKRVNKEVMDQNHNKDRNHEMDIKNSKENYKTFLIPKKKEQEKIQSVLNDLDSDSEVESPNPSEEKHRWSSSEVNANTGKIETCGSKTGDHASEKEPGYSSSQKQHWDKLADDKYTKDKHKHDNKSHKSSEKNNLKRTSDTDSSHPSHKHMDKKLKCSTSSLEKSLNSSSSSDKPVKSSSLSSDKPLKSSSSDHSVKPSSSSLNRHKTDTDNNKHTHSKDCKHSQSDKKEQKLSSDNSSKSSKGDISLDDLREQVKQMKEDEAKLAKEIEKEKKLQDLKASAMVSVHFQKSRQGVEWNEVEDRKAKILSQTQMILERTKARLAQEKEGQKQARQRGKRSTGTGDKEKPSDKDKIKSRCIIKDDVDSDSDEKGEFNPNIDLSFNQDAVRTDTGNILKDIKKKIDEKLGNYNFPEKPPQEKKKVSISNKKKIRTEKDAKRLHDNKKYSERLSDKHRHKHRVKDHHKSLDKREQIKELMRKDYESNFTSDVGEKQKPKKPVIIRRNRAKAPPPNFTQLLKIAEEKCQEFAPEQIVKSKKKEDDRLLTQEEIDRRKRAEERRKFHEEEEAAHKIMQNNTHTTKRDSNVLNSTRTVKSGADVKGKSSVLPNSTFKQGPQMNQKSRQRPHMNNKDNKDTKDVTEHENVIVCRPSSSVKSRPIVQQEATNPWDRIYGQIQKNNPKRVAEKRKLPEDSEEEDYEEEDEYDDDFIDDGGDHIDYSSEIRNIFGYDKRKFQLEDDDDIDNMEASFATVMKEEARSAKIGKMEDLEDIRREEEELRKKKMMAKKMKR